MKLFAISDLHLDYQVNREAIQSLPSQPEDWVILAGDISSKLEHLQFALEVFCARFAKVFWVPGNHDLWKSNGYRGVEKYEQLIETCRQYGVLTPEDPYELAVIQGQEYLIAPLFLLYDYSFRPADISEEQAIDWAKESGILCTDEAQLDPFPYGSKKEWCHARIDYTEQRLSEVGKDIPLILINHFPMRNDLIRLYRIPRFSIWCGTTKTEDWHRRFPVSTVITGHLHMRATDYRDRVRFEEVSLGYPKHWKPEKGILHYLREIHPGPSAEYENAGPFWWY